MKKLSIVTFLLLALLLSASPILAATETEEGLGLEDKGAFVNAEENNLIIAYGDQTIVCENAAIKSGDVTYLPLREVLEAYGLSVSWAVGEAEEKVLISCGQGRYQLVLDLKNCLAKGADGTAYMLKHESNVLYLPVHFFADVMNCSVKWDRSQELLTIDPNRKRQAAVIFNEKTGAVSYKTVVNLPEYQKTTAAVSRSSGLESRKTTTVSNAGSAGTYYEQGIASYYGAKFNGRRTSSGEVYDASGYTAAHKTLPFGTVVRVTALWNGSSVDVRITDRGPFVYGRVIDLSTAAANKIGMIGKGIGPVSVQVLSYP